MAKTLSLLLMLSLASVAVFGFFMIGENHNHGGCFAALARLQGIFCPGGNESFSFVNFHFDFFRSFSNAFVLDNIAALTLAISVIFLAIFGVAFFKESNFLAFAPIRQGGLNEFLSKVSFVRYLSFLENSPNLE